MVKIARPQQKNLRLGVCLTIVLFLIAAAWVTQDVPSVVNIQDTLLTTPGVKQQHNPSASLVDKLSRLPPNVAGNYSPTVLVTTSAFNDVCTCDLANELNCLGSMKCLPADKESIDADVRMGIETRKAFKRSSDFKGSVDKGSQSNPIGKSLQYATINTIWQWTEGKGPSLPRSYLNAPSMFINSTKYPFCRQKHLSGFSCFFRDVDREEDYGNMELSSLQSSPAVGNESLHTLEDDVARFRSEYSKGKMPALGYLLSFAHLTRMLFNRQPFLEELYQQHLTTLPASQDVSSSNGLEPLRVSVHLRRADACHHKLEGFEKEASPINSPAQTSNVRKCYETAVYMKALLDVKNSANGRALEVYLSSDFAGSVIDEIKDKFPDLYKSVTWHYLKHERSMFAYRTSMIEADENPHLDVLGESAVSDLWLISHGQVFVGHVGSRFGKLGWLLSVARHNSFVPYFSVDGHSFCCDIDEPCGEMAPYIRSMSNCMTFTMISLGMKKPGYWEVGNLNRRTYFNTTGFGKE